MKTRLARPDDLPAIMEIERESFEEVGEAAMASETMMRNRIIRCNAAEPGWFWVAVSGNTVEGYVVLQPTTLEPDSCTSWDISTDNGTLERTFNNDGETVFGVSLGTRENAPSGTFYMLVYQGVLLWAKTHKKRLMLC